MKIWKKVGNESGNEIEVVLEFPTEDCPFRVIKAANGTWSIGVYSTGYLKAVLTEVSLGQLQQLFRQIADRVSDWREEKSNTEDQPVLRVQLVICHPDPQMGSTPAAILICRATNSRWMLENMGYDDDEAPSDPAEIEQFIERMRQASTALNATFEVDQDLAEYLEELRDPGEDE